MDQHRQLEQLLRHTGQCIDYSDGSAARVWAQARRSGPRHAQPLRWLAPAALALTVMLTVAAVPQARAAVGELLGRLTDIMDYMVQDVQDRPQNTAVASLVQTTPGADATARPGDGGNWINAVKVHIDEALYDGEFVYIKYTVDSNGLSSFMGGFPTPKEGESVPYKEFLPGDIKLPDHTTLGAVQYGQRDMGGGIWKDVAKYSAGRLATLNGKVDMVFTVQFNNNVETADGGTSRPAGQVYIPFALDVDAGNNALQRPVETGVQDAAKVHAFSGAVIVTDEKKINGVPVLTNRKVSLDGCYLIVDSVISKPTETRIILRFIPSAEIAQLTPFSYKQLFVSPVLLNGDKVVGDCKGWRHKADGSYEMDVTAPLLSEEVQTVTVKTSFLYAAHCNGQEMVLDQSITPGDGWDADIVGQPIQGGTFTVETKK